jgi:hypothetical protein
VEHIEASAWSLAGGAFSVFAIAIVLKQAPWQFTFAVLAGAVAFWALRGTAVTGGVLGAIAWAFHTGFDVAKTGDLVLSGDADLWRLGALVGVGLIAHVTGALVRVEAPRRPVRAGRRRTPRTGALPRPGHRVHCGSAATSDQSAKETRDV